MSALVGNPEDRFSHETQIQSMFLAEIRFFSYNFSSEKCHFYRYENQGIGLYQRHVDVMYYR